MCVGKFHEAVYGVAALQGARQRDTIIALTERQTYTDIARSLSSATLKPYWQQFEMTQYPEYSTNCTLTNHDYLQCLLQETNSAQELVVRLPQERPSSAPWLFPAPLWYPHLPTLTCPHGAP